MSHKQFEHLYQQHIRHAAGTPVGESVPANEEDTQEKPTVGELFQRSRLTKNRLAHLADLDIKVVSRFVHGEGTLSGTSKAKLLEVLNEVLKTNYKSGEVEWAWR